MGSLVLLFITLVIAAVSGAPELTYSPSNDVNWKTTVNITCKYEPYSDNFPPGFTHNNVVIGSLESSYKAELEAGVRIILEHRTAEGLSVLTMKDVKAADSGDILCMVAMEGISPSTSFSVLEPPSYTVADIAATPDYTSAEVTFTGDDSATKYKCEYKTLEEVTWTTVDEVTDTTCSFSDLTPATVYSVRVMAGNAADYRDDITVGEGSFTTQDNRTPEMLGDVTVTPESYNSTIVQISWSLGANAVKGITVDSVVIVVNGNEVEVVDGDDVSVSIDLGGGAGDYEITVIGKNIFSEEGNEERSVVSHSVLETTAAPTVPPKPATEKPVDVVVDDGDKDPMPPRGLQCSGGKGKEYQTQVREQTSGAEVSLKCSIADNSDLQAGNITFSYDGSSNLDQNALLNSPGVTVTVDEDGRSKTLTILALSNSHQGTYKCSVGPEACEYQLIVGEEVRGGTAATTIFSTLLFSLLSLLHFF